MENEKIRTWKRNMRLAGKEKRVPVSVQFELTPRCNFDCKMCYVHNETSNQMKDKELSTEQWIRIFDEAYDCGMMFATLTGGECLLRDDFVELYLHLWKKRVFVSVFTNGALINDEYITFFKKYLPDTIRISLYGSSNAGYRNVTGHSGYEKVLDNVRKLLVAGINVELAVTPSKYIADDYINTLLCAHKTGAYLTLSEMMLIEKRDDPESTDHFLTADEIVKLSIEQAQLFFNIEGVSETPEPCGKCQIPPKGLTCNAGNGFANVLWDGKIYPCGNIMVGGFSMLEMSFAEAWEKVKAAADAVIRPVECVDCPYDSVCPRCMAYRWTSLNSGHCNTAVCDITRKLVAAGVKKLEQPAETCD